MKDKIIAILAKEYPLTAKAIYEQVNQGSYSYTHKLLKELVQKNILEEKERKYELSEQFIEEQTNLSRTIQNNYRIEQNMFLDANNKNVLALLPRDEKQAIEKEIQKVLNKKIEILLEQWYEEFYDPAKIEEKEILKQIKDQHKILEIGCGTGRITQVLIKAKKDVVALEKEKNIAEFTKKKIPGAKVLHQDFVEYTSKQKFDCIIGSWAGVHYQDTRKILRKCKELLKKGGKLLLIEPYYETDYIKLLQIINPRDPLYSKGKYEKLKKELFEEFGDIEEKIIQTEYIFPDTQKLKQTMRIETVYEERKPWTEETEKKLTKAIKILKHPLKIGEAPVFLTTYRL